MNYQLGVSRYTCSGKIYGIPFKMLLKTESTTGPDVIRRRCFGALLFTNLVNDDVESFGLIKKPWATLNLDVGVSAQPGSIETLIVQMLQNSKIGMTCGNIRPSMNQKSLVARVQAAEYIVHNRIAKNAEALLGVVSYFPGTFLLTKYESFQSTVRIACSINNVATL